MLYPWSDETSSWTPEAIVRLRRQLGWTQEKLARQIGRSTAAISKWEIGAKTPNLDSRRALDAVVLGVERRLA